MASYHCNVSTVSRSDDRSAVAAAAYRAGQELHDERQTVIRGEPVVHDYTRRTGVVFAGLVLPPDAPEWASDREAIWNAAEAAETRGNSCVAREFEIGLPAELSEDARRELALGIAEALVERYGFAADVAIHLPPRDGSKNHHTHILCTTRQLGADGFGAKTRVLDDRRTGPAEVVYVRELVAHMTNAAYAAAGLDLRVDHRSLVDQREAALADGDEELAAQLDRPAQRRRSLPVYQIAQRGEYSPIEERLQHEEQEARQAYAERAEAEAQLRAAVDAEAAIAEAIAEAQAELEEAKRVAQRPSSELTPVDEPAPRLVPKKSLEVRSEVRKAALAFIAPAPVRVPVNRRAELDTLIDDAEARLSALEEREKLRQKAAEAYRRSQVALQAAQAGVWARLRALVGLGPTTAETRAQNALRGAAQAVRAAGGVVTFQQISLPDTAERVQLKKQLMGLRDERTELVAEAAAAARRTAAAVDQVMDLVDRADRVVPIEQRQGWPALRALDVAGGLQQLRDQLSRDPGLAIALAHDLGRRLPEIERLEAELSATDSEQDDDLGPVPGM